MMTEKTQDKFNFSIEGKDYEIHQELNHAIQNPEL